MSQINYVRFPKGNLWAEAFGDISNPLVILIAGSEKQSIYWSDLWCHVLAKEGYSVVRFDHRDTGLSTHINFNAHPYRLRDMADDILSILKFYRKERAHLIGSGMGGYLAQMIALSHPEKVASLVLLMTTHDARPIEQKRHDSYRLPSTSPDVIAQLERVSRIAVNNPNWFLKTIQKLKLLNGADAPFDENEWEITAIKLKERMSQKSNSAFFHHHLLSKTLSKLSFESNKITQSTLIIHGDADPVIPITHAYSTKKFIPRANLVVIEGMGHLLTSFFESKIAKEIVNHLKSNEQIFA
jgi:pimeloyl-ACP methyl ester carboxylesterase